MANAIYRGSTLLTTSKLGSGQIQKVYRGTDLIWQNIQTGNYYIMTSDTTPSPFVASTFNNGAYSTAGSAYQAFDNNNGTYYAGNTTVSGQYVGAQITFNNSINLRKIGVRIGNAGGGRSNGGNIKVDVLTNGSWTNIINYGVSAGGEYENYNVSAMYSNVTAIRGYFVYGSGSTASYAYIYHLQVIEWS